MTKIQDLRQLAHTIKTETKVGGNTADRVGSAFEGVADALDGTEQIAEMDKAVQEVQKKVDASKAQIQSLVNALPVVQQTGDSTTSVMSQKAVSHELSTKADAAQVNNSLYNLEKKIGDRFVIEGNVTNLPDEEDLTSVKDSERDVLKLADRSYSPEKFSGKGYKILRKNIKEVTVSKYALTITSGCTTNGDITITVNSVENNISVTTDYSTPEQVASLIASSIDGSSLDGAVISFSTQPTYNFNSTGVQGSVSYTSYIENRNVLTQSMINEPNTIYEIRYDFDLNGSRVALNEGASLYLVGGDIKNGKLVCNNTHIYGNSRLSCELYKTYFYEGKADGVDLIETNNGISFKDNITYNAKNNERNKVFLRPGINYKSLMYPTEIINKYSLTGEDRFMINTDYFLVGNIDLGGKDASHWLKFGKGCSLTNLGGSIYNGYVVFTDLKIIGKYPFKDLTDNSSLELEINIDQYSNIDLSNFINTILPYKHHLVIRLGVGKYELSAPITIPKYKTVVIIGSGKTKYVIRNQHDYNTYQSHGSLLAFNNTDRKYKNISVFSGEGILYIENTSLCLIEGNVSYTLNDSPKPSDFNSLSLGDTNINGINVNELSINNCSLFCFTNAGIVIRQAFQIIENTDILYCRTGIKAEINLAGDEQFLNLYIRYCEIGMELNSGHINITKLWIDEITKYAILINKSNSILRIIDLHINHCNYAGIKVKGFNRAMIVGTINRCGCYYAGFDIKDVPEEDLDKCCNIYANTCINSTLMFNSSYMKVDDPQVQSNYGQVSAPVIDIVANNFSYNNVLLNSNFKNKIYNSNSQKTSALCKIKTQYNNNFFVNNGVECNLSNNEYVIETSKIGNTNNRPNLDANSIGFDYYDTDLKKKILWNGTTWVNIDGTELS